MGLYTPRYASFYDYLKERETVRLAKEAGQSWPWTQDKILQTYKFTNVRRAHDKTSMELQRLYRAHWDGQLPKATGKQILLNCAIARYFGTWEFMWALGWQVEFHPERIKKLAKERLVTKQRVFTGAYVITNQGISKPKEEVVVDYFLTPLWEKADDIAKCAKDDGHWKRVAGLMSSIPGFGGTGFMSKEITLDTMYFPQFWPVQPPEGGSQPHDYDTWTPIGPGARRGLARVFSEAAVATTEDGMLRQVISIKDRQGEFWPAEWGTLSPTDIQFGLCEFSKYEKVRLGEGRPRSCYNAPKEK